MRCDRLCVIRRFTKSAATAVAPSSRSLVFVIAKYSSPPWSLIPWHEKCSSRRSSGERLVRNSSTASLTTCAGSFSSVRTSKPPISGSPSTAARAAASAVGARSSLSPGSR